MKINPAVQAYSARIQEYSQVNVNRNSKADFGTMLKNELNKVNELLIKADEASQQLIKGEAEDIHSVLLAAEEARLALEMAVQVRNKLVESYQEINRMQL
ncbi:MAG TPA: flagellar hook-basal body complex protein FliE [Clostridiales bacterium]|nr:flagellar hook-basal body complex protein FliE [Clostridiales bacterium]